MCVTSLRGFSSTSSGLGATIKTSYKATRPVPSPQCRLHSALLTGWRWSCQCAHSGFRVVFVFFFLLLGLYKLLRMQFSLITPNAVSQTNVKCHPCPIDFPPSHRHLKFLKRLPASNPPQRKTGLTMPAQYQVLIKTKTLSFVFFKKGTVCSNEEWVTMIPGLLLHCKHLL